MDDLLRELVQGRTLTEDQARQAFDAILEGRANESQVGALLALIARRGPTLDELVGAARAMRARATPIPTDGLDPLGALVDTCGTGGAAKTFNISTAAAIVAAAARGRRRALVAKHGGRSRSGRGSAEVLGRLGVNIAASPATQRRCLEEAGVCFAFAVHHHPAMKFAAGPRKSLGFPTIFNVLGPLTNPAGAKRQLLGVYDRRLLALVAEALHRLGSERAMVVHALDGVDELSTTAPTLIRHVRPSEPRAAGGSAASVDEETLDAAALNLPRATLADLQQDATLDAAAARIRSVLAGDRGPARDIVLLNAAGALVVAAAAADFPEALKLAADAIDSGNARRALNQLIELSNA